MEIVSPRYAGTIKGHYSPGIISHGMLYISGQLSIDPDTRLLPEGGIAAHAALALKNVERVLHEAGLTKNDVVQCRVYVTDVALWDDVNAVYAEFFESHNPARIDVPGPSLHFGCIVLIEAIAVVLAP